MVKVKFFASYREMLGKSEINLDISDHITVKEMLKRLAIHIPKLNKILKTGTPIIAINHEIATLDDYLYPNSEVAIFPPVSGGNEDKVRIQEADFDIGKEIEKMKKSSSKIGGIVVFLGVARDFSRGRRVNKLTYEHYPGMTEKKLIKLRENSLTNFDIIDLQIIHRTGEVGINENIVLIISSAIHREDAFNACKWCIDKLKSDVPIWKQENTPDADIWVEDDL
jgi:molybdopterin synthase catalytic subunit|tara:strand:+ start:1863 stop:2534 length:672 start_codon:yes stop_codon:yes gene_type:complete